MTTTNYTFPCDTVNGLTLNQKREAVKALKAAIAESVAYHRQEKEAAKIYKARKATERREAAITKAQARLDRLMAKANPVGAKAAKANRKPSAVTVSASL
jgi:ABC-type nitrate/sulfonate/bicarbonate transport system substrate-binding protein